VETTKLPFDLERVWSEADRPLIGKSQMRSDSKTVTLTYDLERAWSDGHGAYGEDSHVLLEKAA